MEFFAAAPKGDDEIRFNKDPKMFGNGLTGHIEVATKLSQSLAIILVKPVKKLASVFIGQSFKDVGHL